MTWVAVGLTAAGATKGIIDANVAKKKQEKQDAFRKAAITYSPWTGMTDPGAGNFGNQSGLSGALGGGLQGFSMGSMINGMGGGAKAANPTTIEAAPKAAMNYQPNMQGPASPWQGVQQQLGNPTQNMIQNPRMMNRQNYLA